MKPPPLPPRRVVPQQQPHLVYAPPPPPVPVVPLNYAGAMSQFSKPGLLVALAICALVYCAVSLFSNGFTTYVWFMARSESIPPVTTPPAPLPAVSLPPYKGDTLGSRGLPAAQRAPIVAAAPVTGPYAVDRRLMLDYLLREFGQDLVARDGQLKLTPSDTRAGVTPTPEHAQSLTCAAGTITLNNTSAFLSSTSLGQRQVIGDKVVEMGGSQRLRAGALDDQIARIKQQRPKITAKQIDFIADRFVASRSMQIYRDPFVDVTGMDPHGVARIYFNDREYWVLPDGRNTLISNAPQGIDGRTGTPIPPPSKFTPRLPGNTALMAANGVHALLGLALTIYLIVVAIRILAGVPESARGLLRFTYAKIALIAMELCVCIAYFSSVKATASPGQRVIGNFSIDGGIRGLTMSVIIQSCIVLAFMLTMYLSASIRRYLSMHGGLGVASVEFKAKFAEVRRKFRWPLRGIL